MEEPNAKRRSHTSEALILMGQGVSSIRMFAKSVVSDDELFKEIVDLMLIGVGVYVGGKQTIIKTDRAAIELRAKWRMAWEEAQKPTGVQLVGEAAPAVPFGSVQLAGAKTPAAA